MVFHQELPWRKASWPTDWSWIKHALSVVYALKGCQSAAFRKCWESAGRSSGGIWDESCQGDQIPAWAEMFRSHGLGFHVAPYSSISYHPYEYSEAKRRYLEPWIWENRRAGLESVKPDAPITVLCSGDVDHINVQPNGSAWRCILERQLGINPLGNGLILDSSYSSHRYRAPNPGSAPHVTATRSIATENSSSTIP